MKKKTKRIVCKQCQQVKTVEQAWSPGIAGYTNKLIYPEVCDECRYSNWKGTTGPGALLKAICKDQGRKSC